MTLLLSYTLLPRRKDTSVTWDDGPSDTIATTLAR